VSDDNEYDVVVVGGGAAGLNGALVLTRARRRVLVVDAGEPRNALAERMQGFLSRDGLPPAELLEAGRHEVRGYGGEIATDRVTGIQRTPDGFELSLAGGRTVCARRLLLTTGLTDELPDVPGVQDRWGRDVLHCPYCHGWEVRDQALGVLATGPAGGHQALQIRQWSDDVTLFLNTLEGLPDEEAEQLSARGVQLVPGPVSGLVLENDRLSGVQLDDGRVVPRDVLFVEPRFAACDDLLTQLGITTEQDDTATWVPTSEHGETNVPGVWAAGNLTDPAALVVHAAAAGSRAAVAINSDLVDEDAARAVAERAAS
jgi:thioredoxin reductase